MKMDVFANQIQFFGNWLKMLRRTYSITIPSIEIADLAVRERSLFIFTAILGRDGKVHIEDAIFFLSNRTEFRSFFFSPLVRHIHTVKASLVA